RRRARAGLGRCCGDGWLTPTSVLAARASLHRAAPPPPVARPERRDTAAQHPVQAPEQFTEQPQILGAHAIPAGGTRGGHRCYRRGHL
ncbi:MAG: hypothetical protein ACREX8_16420, partial [Gammaproteobacteria bacterium]